MFILNRILFIVLSVKFMANTMRKSPKMTRDITPSWGLSRTKSCTLLRFPVIQKCQLDPMSTKKILKWPAQLIFFWVLTSPSQYDIKSWMFNHRTPSVGAKKTLKVDVEMRWEQSRAFLNQFFSTEVYFFGSIG